MDELLDRIGRLVGPFSDDLLTWAVLALLGLLAILVAKRLLARRRRLGVRPEIDLTIDVPALGEHGPPLGAAVLEFYNVPVRLAAVVLASAGRTRHLPPPEELTDLFEAILPGLADVVATHQPLILRWPNQLSTRGFAHTFFRQAKLPGKGGKGSVWSAAAGLFKVEGQPIMAGMVLRAQRPISRGQEVIEREEQWLAVLRAKAPE